MIVTKVTFQFANVHPTVPGQPMSTPKNKVQLQREALEYDRLSSEAMQAVSQRELQIAISIAVESLTFLDGKIQHAWKDAGQSMPQLDSLRVIFDYAPQCFHIQSLIQLDRWIDAHKKVDRKYGLSLRNPLERVQAKLDHAIALWNEIERGNCSSPSLDEDQRKLVLEWIEEGVVEKAGASFRVSLRWDERWWGKCEQCGSLARDSKIQFLSARECPQCKGVGNFVTIGPAT